MEVTNYYLIAVIFLLRRAILSFASNQSSTCGPGLQTPGSTYPKGDITLEYGSPLEIFCILNPGSTENASSLVFYVDNVPVPRSAQTIVNSTTLRLYIEQPPPSQSMFYCYIRKDDVISTNLTKYNRDGTKFYKENTKQLKDGTRDSKFRVVCLNLVRVGFKPTEVKNFSCVSHNWENMNCSWVPPYNPVETEYTLGFYLKPNRKHLYLCPSGKVINQHCCLWNDTSNPMYRQVYDYYNFNLTASNKLGNLTMKFRINHFANVIPNKPVNLSLVEATSNSLVITWDVPLVLRNFPPGIVNRVIYQAKWDPLTYWEVIDPVLPEKNYTWVYNITGLKYAHTLYDIRVMMRSASAFGVENRWSEPASITLRTKPTVPGRPPKTDDGSFETTYSSGGTTRDIYVYWQQIPRFMENGDKFEYKILKIEEFIDNEVILRNMTPAEITKTFAKFKGLSLNAYRFTIVSSNSEGHSVDASYVEVPSTKLSPPEPVSFSKIAFDNGIYELSWNIAPNIDSYTIFWCDNKQDRPFDCKGFLNWTKVHINAEDRQCTEMGCSLHQKNITLPADKIYQFALSANVKRSSSGMVWASCTVLPEPAKWKLRNVWINRIGSTFIELSWKLECFDRSRIIKGFVISYCPIRDPQGSSCKEPSQNITINGGPDFSRANITSLKPYTTYIIYVAAVSDNWEGGIKSDPLLNTTMEAAPDFGPTNLNFEKVTNTSISLSWQPPQYLNGVLRYYLIYYNEREIRVEDKSDVVHMTLTNLSSFELYEIKVSACTVACSRNSSSIFVKTKIGYPGNVLMPVIDQTTYNQSILVTWDKPLEPRGKLDYYNIKIESDQVKDGEERKTIIREVHGSSFSFKWNDSGCEVYYIQVQPVNIAEDLTLFEGPWSPLAKSNSCVFSDRGNGTVWWFIILVGVLAVIAICISMGYFTRCVWLKCKAMRNLGVKLPPQLEMNTVYKEKNQFSSDQPMSNHVGSNQLKSLDVNLIPPPDQELLLEKKDKDEFNESSIDDCEDVNGDRESSGCGSGHDSVSSSITAGTHITDSGTEADERPPSPDTPVFSNMSRNRNSDLRQRNLAYNNNGGVTPSSAGVPIRCMTVPAAPRGYISHAPCLAPNEAPKGYVTVAALPAPNPKDTMYCRLGLKSDSVKSKDGNYSHSSRDHITDSENVLGDENQFAINPTSSTYTFNDHV